MDNNIKKKVLIFTPGGVGGAERMSVLIGKLLPRERYHVKFVVLGRVRNIYDFIPDDFEVDCIPVRNIYEFSILRIWIKILKERPDVVFTSQVAYNPNVIIAARLAGTKVIVRSSGMIGDYKSWKLRKVLWTYPLAHKLIAQQDDMRNEMIKSLNVSQDKVITIHNPIDTQVIEQLSLVESPYPKGGGKNFVQIASISHRKAQDVAIKAFAFVKNFFSDAHLYFVGAYKKDDKYYQELLELIQELKLHDSVHFIGYDKNPFRWVKNADCFVFPSRAEGLPNALIEASYLGVPCAASSCLNIVADIIKDGQNGYIAAVDDIEGLAQAMINSVELDNPKMVYYPGTSQEFENII